MINKKMKINKKAIITICILAAAAAISGCGKKSAPDAASSQVIQISVAPEETTQTPAPDQIDSSAVTTNGNLTMVNEYLAGQTASTSSDTASEQDSEADSTQDSGENN